LVARQGAGREFPCCLNKGNDRNACPLTCRPGESGGDTENPIKKKGKKAALGVADALQIILSGGKSENQKFFASKERGLYYYAQAGNIFGANPKNSHPPPGGKD